MKWVSGILKAPSWSAVLCAFTYDLSKCDNPIPPATLSFHALLPTFSYLYFWQFCFPVSPCSSHSLLSTIYILWPVMGCLLLPHVPILFICLFFAAYTVSSLRYCISTFLPLFLSCFYVHIAPCCPHSLSPSSCLSLAVLFALSLCHMPIAFILFFFIAYTLSSLLLPFIPWFFSSCFIRHFTLLSRSVECNSFALHKIIIFSNSQLKCYFVCHRLLNYYLFFFLFLLSTFWMGQEFTYLWCVLFELTFSL